MTGDVGNIGMITQCNASACKLFGYEPLELKNHHVEKLMPEMYARHHSLVMSEALAKGPENIPLKQRLVFARHKSSYIFPVLLQLKSVVNVNLGCHFVGLLRLDRRLINSNTAFILINEEKKIHGISSSCMRMMDLDSHKLK